MTKKSCSKCSESRKISCFYKSRTECKSCTKKNRKIYYNLNKDKCLKQMHKYESDNEIVIKEKRKERYRLNKNLKKKYEKEYYLNNKAKIIERERIYNNKRYKEDVVYRLKCVLRKRLYKSVKTGSHVDNLGCKPAFLKKYLESKFQPGMSWENYGKWHIDHVVPLASFDLSDHEQLNKACHYTNLQPLWAKDNLKKGASIS